MHLTYYLQLTSLLEPVLDHNSVPEKPGHNDVKKLSNAEISRYSRQLILPEIGVKGIVIMFCHSSSQLDEHISVTIQYKKRSLGGAVVYAVAHSASSTEPESG